MLDLPRLVLAAAILGIASYHDVRTREIPDYLWAVCGVSGALLYLLDWRDVDLFVAFSMASGGLLSLLAWRVFPMGEADVLAILAISVAYPVAFDGIMVPAVVFFGGLLLEHMAALFYNLRYNVEDLARGRLFPGINGSWHARIAAFYSVHARRPHERFTFCAERVVDGRRTISLRTPSPDSEYETRQGVLVTWAMPAFPFMLAALVAGAVVAYLSSPAP
ncbi:putative Peptidase A24A prepilin type IV protein [Nitrosopumilaceae archaeon]|nr:putative Peptidase A24A prepilin type IV protein [Nitrosopumilaceae archaeon]